MKSPESKNGDVLKKLMFLFLRLGITAFGGPAAHIAMMREEVVNREKWMSDAEFMDLVGATNLIPGPNSTELAIHIGHRMAGWRGLIIAGFCFILPAFFIVLIFAWMYVEYGTLPEVDAVLYGIKPVIIAIIVIALWKLAKSALKSQLLIVMGLAATIAGFSGLHELMILFATAVLITLILEGKQLIARNRNKTLNSFIPLTMIPMSMLSGTSVAFSLHNLFLFFLKVGSVLFGSGYVLLAFLRADLVDRWGWMTEAQLLDAIAVGQFTPGPVFTTATFIGYFLGGIPGAVLATIGIFLPSFVFVAISAPFIKKLRKSRLASAFLDGLNAASFALMAVVTWHLGRASFIDLPTVTITVVCLLLLIFTRIQNTWLIVGGGVIGLLLQLI